LTKIKPYDILSVEDKGVVKVNKLFKIFEWYDVNNGIGEGKTQTYLMAEDKTKALEKFGKQVGDKMPWYGYGARETTKEEFAKEINSVFDELTKIRDFYNDLTLTFDCLE
jgi:hypothetical protein